MARSSDTKVILSKLDGIQTDTGDVKNEVKRIAEYTFRQDERIKTIEKCFNKDGRVDKLENKVSNLDTTITNIKIQGGVIMGSILLAWKAGELLLGEVLK